MRRTKAPEIDVPAEKVPLTANLHIALIQDANAPSEKAPIEGPPARLIRARSLGRPAAACRPPGRAPHDGSASCPTYAPGRPPGPRYAQAASRIAVAAPARLRNPAQPLRPRLARVVSPDSFFSAGQSHPFHRRSRGHARPQPRHAGARSAHRTRGQPLARPARPRVRRALSSTRPDPTAHRPRSAGLRARQLEASSNRRARRRSLLVGPLVRRLAITTRALAQPTADRPGADLAPPRRVAPPRTRGPRRAPARAMTDSARGCRGGRPESLLLRRRPRRLHLSAQPPAPAARSCPRC